MEENKELMKVSGEIEETDEEIEETPERSGIGTGWAMLIGSGLTLAAIAVGKKAKKAWLDRKSKLEQQAECPPVIIEVEPEIVEEPAQPKPPVEDTKKSKK